MSDDNVPNVYEFSENPTDAVQPPLLSDGEYRAVVRGAEQKTSKSSGNQMIEMEYIISADEYPADFNGDPDGTKLKGYVMLSDDPTGRYRYKKACEMHGVVPAKRVNAQDFMGQEVIIRVKSSSYQGEMRYDPANAVRAA